MVLGLWSPRFESISRDAFSRNVESLIVLTHECYVAKVEHGVSFDRRIEFFATSMLDTLTSWGFNHLRQVAHVSMVSGIGLLACLDVPAYVKVRVIAAAGVCATSEGISIGVCIGTLHLFQSLTLQLVGACQHLVRKNCDL